MSWGVFRGHPLAIPLGYPTPPREKVSLRSPLSDGGKASSDTELPIQEATTEGRSLSWVLIDKSPGNQQSGLFRGITPGSLVSSYHQYSSEYSAGTCPVWVGDVAFFPFPQSFRESVENHTAQRAP